MSEPYAPFRLRQENGSGLRPDRHDSLSIRVRPFRTGDAGALTEIFYDAVRAVTLDDYSEDQLRAWASTPPTPDSFLERAADGRLLLVAVDDLDRPLAYGDLEADGHLDHLYRDPSRAAMGAASFLWDALERGLSQLYVEAASLPDASF